MERKAFMKEPSRYTNKDIESFPLDIQYKPRMSVLGLPKSGKSDLCVAIASETGAIHIEMESMIEEFIARDSSFARKVMEKLAAGRELDDILLVNLLQRRVEYADC